MSADTDLPLFSVVIPNWNGAHHLPPCLDALRAQTYPRLEVIVADNASADGSLALLAECYPEVRVIALPQNRGFTGACNAGMQAARGAYVALLTDRVDPAGLPRRDAFERYPDRAGRSKMLCSMTAAAFTRRNLYASMAAGDRGVWEEDSRPVRPRRVVFSACGGSSAYRRALLDDVGLLATTSSSLENMTWRAPPAHGLRCIYTPNAAVYHHLRRPAPELRPASTMA